MIGGDPPRRAGGAGKSTVGALLAERLGATFVDLDHQFHVAIPARTVETMRPVDEVCDELAAALPARFALAPDRSALPRGG